MFIVYQQFTSKSVLVLIIWVKLTRNLDPICIENQFNHFIQ